MSKASKLAGFSTTFDAGISTFKNTTINDTGFLRLPTGTTALRPSAGISTQGMMRYNTTLSKFDSSAFQEPEYDLLSEIINQVNNTYGVNLTDEDRLDLSRLSKRLIEDNEIEKYMKGENTEDNKQNFFKEQFEIRMIDYVKERFDFYKKMDENREMKNFIFDMIYKDYQKQVVQK